MTWQKTAIEKSYGTVDLRPRFQQVWDQLNKIYNLYGSGWLQINPQRLRIKSMYARNDSLNVLLGLSARPVVSFEKPAEIITVLPLMADAGNVPGFNIFLDAVMNYDSLSNLLNRQIAGKEFDFNKGPVKKKFVIRDCLLYGANNEKLIIKVNFGGTDEGVMYLVGKPVYDAVKKQLEIVNIDFDIRSKDALLKTADWLFNKKIINEISRYARYDLTAFIDTARNGINQQLNREWIKGVRGYGQINDLKLVGIYPLLQHLVIRSNCSGELSVKVESIQFSL